MRSRFIAQEATTTTPDGRKVTYYDIYDVVMVEGREMYHKRSDVGFDSLEKAEAWIARQK